MGIAAESVVVEVVQLQSYAAWLIVILNSQGKTEKAPLDRVYPSQVTGEEYWGEEGMERVECSRNRARRVSGTLKRTIKKARMPRRSQPTTSIPEQRA